MGTGRTSDTSHDGGGREFRPLGVVLLAVSDTRTLESDASGAWIETRLGEAGHKVLERAVVRDEVEAIRARVEAWCGDPEVQVVIVTGGTGMTPRDVTPEALAPLLEKPLPGFGELFRWLSFGEIGPATIQSRALAGLRAGRVIFALPGSPRACRLAVEEILLPQLDARTRPCSFAGLLFSPGGRA
ncbi:MAG: molybdenum cofactor synthesis domain-containing protein [Planctomycetota bacterium]